jgi:hypothetical protein
MRALIVTACGWALIGTGALHAQERAASGADRPAAEIALSDQTLQLRYLTGGDSVNVDDAALTYGVFLSEARDVVLSADLQFPTDFNLGRRLAITLGPQVYAALLEEENNDVVALAVGAQARYAIAPDRDLALVGRAYYSPDILTFGSADNLIDLEARLEMRLAKRLTGFAGFRWFEMDLLMRQDRDLQNEPFAGIRWQLE